MNIKDLIGEATEYDKKLALEEKKPKSWCKSVVNTLLQVITYRINDDEYRIDFVLWLDGY